MITNLKFNTTNNDAGVPAFTEGHAVPSSFPSNPCGPLSFSHQEVRVDDAVTFPNLTMALTGKLPAVPTTARLSGSRVQVALRNFLLFDSPAVHSINFTKEKIMKAKRYYSLIGIYKFSDKKYEIIAGDYDRQVIQFEKECPHDDYRCLKIITTTDKQLDIQARVDQENINSGHAKGEWKNTRISERDIEAGGPFPIADEQKKIVTDEQKKIDQLAHVAQAYLVIWFSDLSVQVFSRNYQLISCDPEVASLVIQHKDEFKGDREDCYRSPDNGEIGEARWFHSDPDIIHFLKPSDELVRS